MRQLDSLKVLTNKNKHQSRLFGDSRRLDSLSLTRALSPRRALSGKPADNK